MRKSISFSLALSLLNSVAIVLLAGLALVAYTKYRTKVYSFEKEWVANASEIRFVGESPITDRDEIKAFVNQFAIDNEKLTSLRTVLEAKSGVILIDGDEYELELTSDKFVGESLGVRAKFKYLEFFRDRADEGPRE